ncbi:MAG TPA: hypothetical protein V6C46_10130 [Coleofasciculaceae cyanobacterium]
MGSQNDAKYHLSVSVGRMAGRATAILVWHNRPGDRVFYRTVCSLAQPVTMADCLRDRLPVVGIVPIILGAIDKALNNGYNSQTLQPDREAG